jgi:hypothetical protein
MATANETSVTGNLHLVKALHWKVAIIPTKTLPMISRIKSKKRPEGVLGGVSKMNRQNAATSVNDITTIKKTFNDV